MESILVTGGSGLLGSACCLEYANKFDTNFSYNQNPIKISGCKGYKIDLSKASEVENLFSKINPFIVVHTAALTNLDLCEQNTELARKSNVEATTNITTQCKENNALLVHISTNYVFDGKLGNYSELDEINSISVYAQTKIEAEKQVKKIVPKSFVIRTTPFGWQPVKSRTNSATWFLKDLQRGKKIKAMTDQYASMILANDLATILQIFFDSKKFGTYHVSSKDKMDRYTFTVKIAELLGYARELVEPVTFEKLEKSGIFKAKRPKDSSLDSSKFEKTFNKKLPLIDGCLKKFKELHDRNYLKNFELV